MTFDKYKKVFFCLSGEKLMSIILTAKIYLWVKLFQGELILTVSLSVISNYENKKFFFQNNSFSAVSI